MKYEVITERGMYSLILRGREMDEYAVVYGLNKKTNSWARTCNYYSFDEYSPLTKERALMYALDSFVSRTEKDYIPYDRMTEIATKSVCELFESDELTAMDFFKDDLYLTEYEKEFLGVDEMVKEFIESDDELFYDDLFEDEVE